MQAETESNPPRRRPPYGIYAYTAREWDPEIGLYYHRARYYDPKVGRFISEDPSGFWGGNNFYRYVSNDPVSLTDPKGLREKESAYQCVRRVADKVYENYCANNNHDPDDPSCREAHCITNCLVSRECPGGEWTATMASYWKEGRDEWRQRRDPTSSEGWSPGDQCANCEGRKRSRTPGDCILKCWNIQHICPGP